MQNNPQRPRMLPNRQRLAALWLGCALLVWNLLAPLAHAHAHEPGAESGTATTFAIHTQTDIADHASGSCAFCIVSQQIEGSVLPQPFVVCGLLLTSLPPAELLRLRFDWSQPAPARFAARAPPQVTFHL